MEPLRWPLRRWRRAGRRDRTTTTTGPPAWLSTPALHPVARRAPGNPLVGAPLLAAPEVAGTVVLVVPAPVPPGSTSESAPRAPHGPRPAGASTAAKTRSRSVEEDLPFPDADAFPFEPTPESGSEPSPELFRTADDGLAGVIAMLDAEVVKGQLSGGQQPPSAADPDRPSLLRPTLAGSRRRGVRVRHEGTAVPPAAADSPPDAVTRPDARADVHPDVQPGALLSTAGDTEPRAEAKVEPVASPGGGATVHPGRRRATSKTAPPSPAPAAEGRPALRPVNDQELPHDDARAPGPERQETPGQAQPSVAPAAVPPAAPPRAAARVVRPTVVEPERPPATRQPLSTPPHGHAVPPVERAPAPPVAAAELRSPTTEQPTARPAAASAPPRHESATLPFTPLPAQVEAPDEVETSHPTSEESPGPTQVEAPRPLAPLRRTVLTRRPRVDREPGWEPPENAVPQPVRPSAPHRGPAEYDRSPSTTVPAAPLVPCRADDVRRRESTTDHTEAPASTPAPTRAPGGAWPHMRPEPPTPSVPAAPAASSAGPRTTVPPTVVAAVGRMTGTDLGFVPVVRIPHSDPSPAELGARAYTRGGVVHLPEDTGDDDRMDNQALLAHELTHVLQQRTMGYAADEHGPLGPALEAQAAAVERGIRGHDVDPSAWSLPGETTGAPPMYVAWTPDQGFSTGVVDSVVADEWAPHDQTGPESWAPTQRAPAASSPDQGDIHGGGPTVISGLTARPGPEPESQPLVYPEDPFGRDQAPSASEPSPAAPAPLEVTDELLASLSRRLHVPQQPSLDTDDPALLDQLASGLYPRLRRRLRSELLHDRERAGLLTEMH